MLVDLSLLVLMSIPSVVVRAGAAWLCEKDPFAAFVWSEILGWWLLSVVVFCAVVWPALVATVALRRGWISLERRARFRHLTVGVMGVNALVFCSSVWLSLG